jgi:hypothetical protein
MSKQDKTQKIDAIVLELFNTVKQKKADILALSERPNWETSCTIGLVEGNITTNVNIQTVSDINKLVELYAFLLVKEDYYTHASADLGVKTVSKWQGYSFSSWKKDLKTRANIIGLNVKKQELTELENRLNALISPEQRRELELAEIQKLVSKHE